MNKYIIAIGKIKGIGPAKVFEFIKSINYDFTGISEKILTIDKNKDGTYNTTVEIDRYLWKKYVKESEDIIQKCHEQSIKIISFLDEKYPQKLMEGKGKNKVVPILFYRGNISLIFEQCVTIIGTRRIEKDDNAWKNGELISDMLSKKYIIVSGLALGCDTIAHKACIKNKTPTISVLPGSITNDIYPQENKNLCDEILNTGGLLLTENPFPPKGRPGLGDYIERDRLQAELSDAIVIIKADNSSGTRHAVAGGFIKGIPLYQLRGSLIDLRVISMIPKKSHTEIPIRPIVNDDVEKIYDDIIKNLTKNPTPELFKRQDSPLDIPSLFD